MSIEAITIDHIRQAAEWAAEAGTKLLLIGDYARSYRQTQWDCNTACCMWGAASIIANLGPAEDGPSDAWREQSQMHKLISSLLCSSHTTPKQMLDLLNKLPATRGLDLSDCDLSYADLTGIDLRDANLRNAELDSADLSNANLSHADLSNADLTHAILDGANLRDAILYGARISVGSSTQRIAEADSDVE